MRANRGRYPDRNAAEQLLRGGSAGRPADPLANHDPLACLLAVAAAAPAHDRELAGEAEAVMAFRRALSGPAPQPRRPSMSATKLLVAKAVLAALGVTGGGVALAAATGHMPSNLTGTPAAASSAASATAMPSANGKPATHPVSSPSPSLRGLCQAYTAHVGSSPGKALDSPAFSALITAAGGKDKVAAFCASMSVGPAGQRAHCASGRQAEFAPDPGEHHAPHGQADHGPDQSPHGSTHVTSVTHAYCLGFQTSLAVPRRGGDEPWKMPSPPAGRTAELGISVKSVCG